LPTLFFPQSSISVNDLRHPHRHPGASTTSTGKGRSPGKDPATKLLDFYVQHFDTVELNNSFYRLPPASAFDCWREATPANFVFRVKASRFITHNQKLKDPENATDNLLPRAAHLGPKLGPVLFQLPPHWRLNPERLENLLQILPRDVRYAFEFRELSWMTPQVDSILKKFNAAFCIYELAGCHSPLNITADFAYVRLHGLKAVYFYFENDQAGYAAANALTLKSMVFGTRVKNVA
jgi:uncharacterized protein YecE (DUF72 family)